MLSDDIVFSYLLKKGYIVIQIMMATTCNLKCKYCIQDNEVDDQSWTIEKLNYLCDKAETYCQLHNGKAKIEFIGGEPMLKKRMIKEFLRQREHSDNLIYRTISNGLLLDKEIIDLFYARQGGFVGVSFDEFSLNSLRGLTKEQIHKVTHNIRYISNTYKYRDAIYMMTDTRRMYDLPNTLKSLYQIGARNFIVNSDFIPMWSNSEIETLVNILSDFYSNHKDTCFTLGENDFILKGEVGYPLKQITVLSDGTFRNSLFVNTCKDNTVAKIDWKGKGQLFTINHVYRRDLCGDCPRTMCGLVYKDNDPQLLPSNILIDNKRACVVMGEYIEKVNAMDGAEIRTDIFAKFERRGL